MTKEQAKKHKEIMSKKYKPCPRIELLERKLLVAVEALNLVQSGQLKGHRGFYVNENALRRYASEALAAIKEMK